MQFVPQSRDHLDLFLHRAPLEAKREALRKAATDSKNYFDPDFDPANAMGQDFYRHRVRNLRRAMIGPDWVKDCFNGLEGVKSVDGKFRLIAWISKDEEAATSEESALVHRRGSAGQKVVKVNGDIFNKQIPLFEGSPNEEVEEEDQVTTVVLLVSLDDGRLRARLAIPIEIQSEGNRSRLILGAQYLLMDEAFPGPDSDNGIASPPPSAPAPDFPIDER